LIATSSFLSQTGRLQLDINAKTPSKAAWPMVCKTKTEGGLGVLDLKTQNEARLLKNEHKFFNKANVPWV
jgi:hypothetical protein